jgi:hypothetical protein
MLLVDESPSKCRVGSRLRGNFTTPACCRKLRRLCYPPHAALAAHRPYKAGVSLTPETGEGTV